MACKCILRHIFIALLMLVNVKSEREVVDKIS